MKLLLLILTTSNMITIDTHSTHYEHIAIETTEAVYHVEEDYSITVEYKEVSNDGSQG